MRRFSVYKRSNSPYYYCQIKNPKTGKYLPPKSTGKVDEDEALLVVADWIKYGMPQKGQRRNFEDIFMFSSFMSYVESSTITEKDASRIVNVLKNKGLIESVIFTSDGPDTQPLIPFLKTFWNFEKSPYVKEKHSYGQKIGQRHCYEQSKRLSHWEEYFIDFRIKDVDKQALKEFQFYLSEKGLAPKTINHVLSAGLTAFKWMYEDEKIKTDPGHGLKKFSGESESRGILTTEETKKLFTLEWKDERARIGNLVACTTGLRAGEVLAIKPENIGDDLLYVKHSFSRIEDLKDTKNHEEGIVPLVPIVREELLKLSKKNTFGTNGYIFYSESPDKPMSQNILRRGLEDALIKLRAGNNPNEDQSKEAIKYWEERNVLFHSWRHYYATHLAERVDLRTAQIAMRHKTEAMTKHYSNHVQTERMKEIAAAVGDAFGNIIEFSRKRA